MLKYLGDLWKHGFVGLLAHADDAVEAFAFHRNVHTACQKSNMAFLVSMSSKLCLLGVTKRLSQPKFGLKCPWKPFVYLSGANPATFLLFLYHDAVRSVPG